MRCPQCGQSESKVVDSHPVEGGVRRRRRCGSCGERFATYEQLQDAVVMVLKRDGRRERFQCEKLLHSLRVAASKRPLPAGAIEAIADDIEQRLSASGQPEVGSRVIGEMAITHLRSLDPIAYIRFASAYRQFVSLDDMLAELQQLGSSPLPPAEQPRLFHDEMERIVSGEELPRPPTPIASARSPQPV